MLVLLLANGVGNQDQIQDLEEFGKVHKVICHVNNTLQAKECASLYKQAL